MKFEPGYLFGMALQSIPEPRKVARDVLSLNFPRAALWQAFALFAVLSTGLGVAASMLFPPSPEFAGSLMADPLRIGMVEAASMVITIFAIYWMGRAFGGHGSFPQAILTMIWLEYLGVLVQLIVLILALFAPGMALLFNLFGIVLGVWNLTFFVTEMHGFRSAGLVFAVIVLTFLAVGVLSGLLLAIIGVGAAAASGVM